MISIIVKILSCGDNNMRRKILIISLLATCGDVLSSKNEGVSSSTKKHEKQRRAMLQALNDNNSASLFISPQEQRSQYYIHEGMQSAIQRSLRMANFDVDSLWDYLDGVMGGADEDGGDGIEIAYSQFLEEVLTDMIKEVENSLQKITVKDEDAPPQGETQDGNDSRQKSTSDTTTKISISEAANSDDGTDPGDAILAAFDQIHDDLHCDNYKNVTLDDPKGKWDNITKAYWNFFSVDPPTKLNPPPSGDDYDFYTTEGNVYFDFLHNYNVQVPYLPIQTKQRGMFAARDFERDELVYSFMANGLFFLELSKYEAFVRNSNLLPAYDACLLAQWSFAQKLTRPGRYYICSSLDEGAFFNSGWGGRVNVYMEDSRDLKYYAARNIAEGEEIIYSLRG